MKWLLAALRFDRSKGSEVIVPHQCREAVSERCSRSVWLEVVTKLAYELEA